LSDLSSISNHQDVFGRLVDMTLDIVRADDARFFVVTDERRPALVAQSGERDGEAETAANPMADHAVNERAERELEALISEAVADQLPMLISKNNGKRLPANVLSCVVVPLMIRNKVFGVLTAAIRHGDHRFSENDLYYLSFLTQHAANSIEKLALYENIYNNLFSTLYAFVKAIEVKDPYTQQHSSRVTDLSLQLGEALGCSREELDILNFAGPLHDIGKIGIPDSILLKPGSLTDAEYEKIKEHPELGADIVGKLGMWDREQELIRCHHERYDGTGYPAGLKGDQIPLLARILSVADAYDAMASDRAYRKRMETEKVLNIIRNAANTQFDPDVVEALLSLHDQGKIVFAAA
jgi:putative nucleotidyltransferase with HDIG domain